jgi:flavin reductase (DIM6/NTAB) family NADH-FMN oxidoreductase RutF
MTNKTKLGAGTYLYPMSAVLLGAKINGKPNFATIAYCGMVQHQPPLVAFGSGKGHYSNEGIKKARSFSLNIPSAAMAKVTDYCGLVSGQTTDKSKLFNVFYGVLRNAPMIEECPLSLECKFVAALDLGGTNEVFIGEVVETYAEESVLSGGMPDIRKLDPLVFSMHENQYFKVGDAVGAAWSIGKNYVQAKK